MQFCLMPGTQPREEINMKTVHTAAAMIREDMWSKVYDNETYPPPADIMNDVRKLIPTTL